MRLFTSIFFACLAPLFAWLAGYNFDERGAFAFGTALLAFFFGVFTYTWPGWTRGASQ